MTELTGSAIQSLILELSNDIDDFKEKISSQEYVLVMNRIQKINQLISNTDFPSYGRLELLRQQEMID